MRLYGVMVVQNEEDIIEDTLEFLRKINVFEKIFFFDLGSEDDTFSKAKKFTDLLHNPRILNETFTVKLKYDLLKQQKGLYKEGDWLAIIDADEFYADNPIDLIKVAELEGATCINTYQADFMFTDSDLRNFEHENLDLPIYERRKHYLIDWSEVRFYKVLSGNRFFDDSKPCSRRLFNRHYQFRTPDQIKTRIKTRLENRKKARNLPHRSMWLHVFSTNWMDYVTPHKMLHEYAGGELKFGIPDGVRWKDYYSKSPFSSVLPQVATALSRERATQQAESGGRRDSVNPQKKEIQCTSVDDVSKIDFKDCFSKHVIRDILNDAKALEWREAFLGLIVLMRYFVRICAVKINVKSRLSKILRES